MGEKEDQTINPNQKQIVGPTDNTEMLNQFIQGYLRLKEVLQTGIDKMAFDFKQATMQWKQRWHQRLRQSEAIDNQQLLIQMQSEWNQMANDYDKIVDDTKEAIRQKQDEYLEMVRQCISNNEESI